MRDYLGARLMLEQDEDFADLPHPFGRGISIEIETNELEALCARLNMANHRFRFETQTYRTDESDCTQDQIWPNDPDGYLLRFSQVVSIH